MQTTALPQGIAPNLLLPAIDYLLDRQSLTPAHRAKARQIALLSALSELMNVPVDTLRVVLLLDSEVRR